jgi:hypothetical protein
MEIQNTMHMCIYIGKEERLKRKIKVNKTNGPLRQGWTMDFKKSK